VPGARYGRLRAGRHRQHQHDGRQLRAGRHGHIRASRAALELLAKAWAAEYGPRGVRVSAVAPRLTRTPANEGFGDTSAQLAALVPAGRVADPAEIAYLASDDASFIYGVTIPVDGGRIAT
jgi:NAD(P)-dependent dehydrogenase (short-subunit alcohol dehydrogenase family)